MRSQLLTYLTTALSTSTAVKCASELPWDQNGQPLFLKNLKKLYLDQEYIEEVTLFEGLDGSEIFEDGKFVRAYFAVDAKNPPSTLNAAISTILAAKAQTGEINHGSECDYTIDKQEDVLIYNFEFRVKTIS